MSPTYESDYGSNESHFSIATWLEYEAQQCMYTTYHHTVQVARASVQYRSMPLGGRKNTTGASCSG